MSSIALEGKARSGSGKGVSRKLRSKGLIPAVVYGKDIDTPVSLYLDKKSMERYLLDNGINKIIELSVKDEDGKSVATHTCMICDYQRDALYRHLTHIDFKQIRMEEEVTAKVSVKVVGESAVRSRGGIPQIYMRQIQVKALPADIPSAIDVDLTGLKLGQRITVSKLETSDKVKVLDNPSIPVVSIMVPRALAKVAKEAEGDEG